METWVPDKSGIQIPLQWPTNMLCCIFRCSFNWTFSFGTFHRSPFCGKHHMTLWTFGSGTFNRSLSSNWLVKKSKSKSIELTVEHAILSTIHTGIVSVSVWKVKFCQIMFNLNPSNRRYSRLYLKMSPTLNL